MRDPMSPRPKRAGLKMRLTIKQQDEPPAVLLSTADGDLGIVPADVAEHAAR